jgi:murein DD-endopeptidase MepM/ murein hydrolase activator NlpD
MGQLPSAGVVYQPSSRAMADAGMLRASLNQLASKVGELQARLIEMDSVSQRVAKVAGISYTDPEVQASLEEGPSIVMDEPAGMAVPYESAEALGRRLDDLDRRLARQRDSFALLDLVMTRRAGTEAGLPSVAPVNYPFLSSSYGWRRHPISGRMAMHEGLDFAAPYGAPIHAASGGVVVYAGYKPGYGKTVEIQHGSNLLTRYAHASKLQVKTGDLVEKGQLVANVGTTGRSTGPHLHFEVRIADQPLNPSLFLPADTDSDQTLVASALGDEGATDPEVR